MSLETFAVRFATSADAQFVQEDQSLPLVVVQRKIEWGEIIVAELNGQSVAHLRLEYLWSKIPYIGLIRVGSEHRRQGLGKALLLFAEEFLREQGHGTLYSSSQVDEAESQVWHRHVGFEECGVLAGINEGGVGELFFRKRL